MDLRFVSSQRLALGFLLAAACGGAASSGGGSSSGGVDSGTAHDAAGPGGGDAARAPETGRGGTSTGGTSGTSSSGITPAECAQLEADYQALRTTPAYLTCAAAKDCTIASGDICISTPDLSLNAAGRAQASSLETQYSNGHCAQDCGSASSGGLTAACPAGKCVALYSDGGIAP